MKIHKIVTKSGKTYNFHPPRLDIKFIRSKYNKKQLNKILEYKDKNIDNLLKNIKYLKSFENEKSIIKLYLEVAEEKAIKDNEGNPDPDNYCREVLENLKDLIR